MNDYSIDGIEIRPYLSRNITNEEMYEITPTQEYWLDDDIDREFKLANKLHGTVYLKIERLGHLNAGAFRKAIAYLLQRHESLRSTYSRSDDGYVMRIINETDPGFFLQEYSWPDGFASADLDAVEDFVSFKDHDFNFEAGPLFLVRWLAYSDEKHIVAFKWHHIICDTWSTKIMFRDLFAAYDSFCMHKPPELPVLKYQYKEYLSFLNEFSGRFRDAHKQYWESLYSSIPKDFVIPGVEKRQTPATERVMKIEHFSVPRECVERLIPWCKKCKTTLFIVLQAAFKRFMVLKSGQNDVIVGTYIFGRNHPGTENQIGCYARTELIRTVFEKDESFYVSIRNVKKSNEDMYNYSAYSLKEAMYELQFPEKKGRKAFWNVNLQYSDEEFATVNAVDSEKKADQETVTLSRPSKATPLIGLDMQVNFINNNLKSKLSVKVEYDGSLYNPDIIKAFLSEFIIYLDRLASATS